MSSCRLDALPKELIAHIACFAPPSSVLNFGATCRRIRAACHDSLVFKDILSTSQTLRWHQSTLEIDAIAIRAGNDIDIWARYAVADERLWELTYKECPLESPKNFINFLPELFVVRHPFMNDAKWKRFLRDRVEQKPNQVYCLALAILAQNVDMPQVFRSLQMEDDRYLKRDESMKGFLWALCTIALTLRATVKNRLSAWPYNDSARVPYIEQPKAHQIPFQPLNDTYTLPAPFSRRAVELLGNSTTSFSNWDSWFRLHSQEAFRSPTYLTEGSWCGYYVHFGGNTVFVDPPMMDIKFESSPEGATGSGDVQPSNDIQSKKLSTGECRDGIGVFTLYGTMTCSTSDVQLRARKQYTYLRTGWDWDCRLTPFGIIGYWGTNDDDKRLNRYGIVWLWKKDWTGAGQQPVHEST